MQVRGVIAALLGVALLPSVALADEGMWTYDNFPSKVVQQRYGFAPDKAWLDHVQRSTLRTGGCSASFISPNGLVMTNHHCVVGCVGNLSTPQQNYVQDGFIAKQPEDEKQCPGFEINRLVSITDVTARMRAAIGTKTGNDAVLAERAASAALQQTCGTDPKVRCDVVSLYKGGVYKLYRFDRFQDVRLVFAPEYSVGQFGGDPDNFNFPRYGFDLGLLRIYVNGKPLSGNDYLRFSPSGSKDGQLVFAAGNPGGTSRQLTYAQLEFERDRLYPVGIPSLMELRGQLEQFSQRGPEQAREARQQLFGVENTYKAQVGRDAALLDPAFMASRRRDEAAFRAKVAANPTLRAAYGSAWDDIARIQTVRTQLTPRYASVTALSQSTLMRYAVQLVRAGDERLKPNAQRLEPYTDQALVALQAALRASVPIYNDLEELNLTLLLDVLRRNLGTDDPFVKKLLGSESPQQLAHRVVTGTKLADPATRLALYQGGKAAVDASTDPLFTLAKLYDVEQRALQTDYDARVTAPTRTAADKIARARFAIFGTSVYPDATFSPRISFGSVTGFSDLNGHTYAPYTNVGGLYARATGAPPYDLPATWLAAKSALDPATPMNLSATLDIIGGNSGSPLIDRNAQIVGLVFDGNIFSLGGLYGYDPTRNRGVAVDSRALLAGLTTVYHFDRIVSEIGDAQR